MPQKQVRMIPYTLLVQKGTETPMGLLSLFLYLIDDGSGVVRQIIAEDLNKDRKIDVVIGNGKRCTPLSKNSSPNLYTVKII